MGSVPDWTNRNSSSKKSSPLATSRAQQIRNPVASFLQGEGSELSRSPKDSPPTMKKKLCRLIGGIVDADFTSVDGALDALVTNGDVNGDGKHPQKWRFQRPARTPSSVQSTHPDGSDITRTTGEVKTSKQSKPSILKKGLPSGARRRVHFDKDVTVHLLGDDGLVFESINQKLTQEAAAPQVRFRIGYTPYATRTPTEVYDSPPSPPGGGPHQGGAYHSNNNNSHHHQHQYRYDGDDVIADKPVHVTHDTVDSSQVNFTFVEDATRGTVLKFAIPLGREYRPEDIVVKANVSGSRVRLVANRRVACGDGSMRIEQLSRRYILPMDVDPYLVGARLDIRGNLSVEAPLLTMGKRESMKRSSHGNTSPQDYQ